MIGGARCLGVQPGGGDEPKAIPAHLMGVKQNQKQSHPLHHAQSGRLHVAAMSLTGDQGSSNSMSLLGREIERETLHGQKEESFVSIDMFTLHPVVLSLRL